MTHDNDNHIGIGATTEVTSYQSGDPLRRWLDTFPPADPRHDGVTAAVVILAALATMVALLVLVAVLVAT